MFTAAILIGIYSYLLFGLGLLGLFYKELIFSITLIFIFIILFFTRKKWKNAQIKKEILRFMKQRSKLEIVLIGLIFLQTLANLIGALGPELSFDALWYHLTLPKIYLANHSIMHIPGGLFYYSDMPKLIELLYGAGLAFGSEIYAKLIHFSFGVLCLIALYQLSRKLFSQMLSFLVIVIFYSNLVVGWQSITAYVDLARTFFEIMALWGFINWSEKKEYKWLIESAVMLGLAISTKLLAIGSLLVFSVIIISVFLKKKQFNNLATGLFFYWFICLLIPLPWFIFSFANTGNPIFPFFSSIYPLKFTFDLINPLTLSDPISPIYIILVPIGLFLFAKLDLRFKIISLYSFLAFFIWQITPDTGGGRFILPYLPAFSILSVGVIREIRAIRIKSILIGMIVLFSLFSILYRFGANFKYIPVLLKQESKEHFLTKHLNFSFGDFYDTDNYFKNNVNKKDMVLLYGFHNLYYIDFPFIDSSWVKMGDEFNYIAVQNAQIPEKFNKWNLIYYNKLTNVRVYTLDKLKQIY